MNSHTAETELHPPQQIQYHPIYEYQDLLDMVVALTKRVEKLETENDAISKRKVDDLGNILYNQQLKMQRVEFDVYQVKDKLKM